MTDVNCRYSLADALLQLTKDLKLLVETGNLNELEPVQQERERVMQALFANLDAAELDHSGWVSVVQEVRALNQELIELAKHARDSAGRELTDLRKMRKAESAYVDIYDGGP